MFRDKRSKKYKGRPGPEKRGDVPILAQLFWGIYSKLVAGIETANQEIRIAHPTFPSAVLLFCRQRCGDSGAVFGRSERDSCFCFCALQKYCPRRFDSLFKAKKEVSYCHVYRFFICPISLELVRGVFT
jgi:hypothetical protein